jgi:hypothetical protein
MIATAGGNNAVPAFRTAASSDSGVATCPWIRNATPQAVPHEAGVAGHLDLSQCAIAGCAGRDSSDALLGHLDTGEQVVKERRKISIEQNLVAPN